MSLFRLLRERVKIHLYADGVHGVGQFDTDPPVVRLGEFLEATTGRAPWPPTLEQIVLCRKADRVMMSRSVCSYPKTWPRDQVLRDMREALLFLHDCGFAHLDVRVENVLYAPVARRYVLIDLEFVSRIGGPWPQYGPKTTSTLGRVDNAMVCAADDLDMLERLVLFLL